MFSFDSVILVVDDSPVMLESTENILREMGYQNIHFAEDGLEALEEIKKHQSSRPVNLVICDWNMPNMSGLELLQQIRSLLGGTDLPFIMLTGMNQLQDVMQAVASGVDTFIVKPLEKEVLKAKLKEVYERFERKQAAKWAAETKK